MSECFSELLFNLYHISTDSLRFIYLTRLWFLAINIYKISDANMFPCYFFVFYFCFLHNFLYLFISFFFSFPFIFRFLSVQICNGHKYIDIGTTTDATELSTRNLRLDVRMLATQWKWSAEIPWNSFILTTKKSGLQASQHVTLLSSRPWPTTYNGPQHETVKLFTNSQAEQHYRKNKQTHGYTDFILKHRITTKGKWRISSFTNRIKLINLQEKNSLNFSFVF